MCTNAKQKHKKKYGEDKWSSCIAKFKWEIHQLTLYNVINNHINKRIVTVVSSVFVILFSRKTIIRWNCVKQRSFVLTWLSTAENYKVQCKKGQLFLLDTAEITPLSWCKWNTCNLTNPAFLNKTASLIIYIWSLNSSNALVYSTNKFDNQKKKIVYWFCKSDFYFIYLVPGDLIGSVEHEM